MEELWNAFYEICLAYLESVKLIIYLKVGQIRRFHTDSINIAYDREMTER